MQPNGVNRRACRAVIVGVCALLLGTPLWAATISGVSPQGEVAQVRQVSVRFSEAVITLGDPRLPDPVTVACTGSTVAGSGRWASERNWVFDYREPLPPGARCSVKLRAGWAPIAAAAPLTGRSEFAFNTGGPAVVQVTPYEGATVEEDQHFLLQLNGPAVEASIGAHAWCEVEGIGERQPVQVVSGAARDAVLAARRVPAAKAAQAVLLRCPRPLPNGASLRLVWGAGIAAAADPKLLTSVAQSHSFQVRQAFTAEFSCERERAEAACLPIRPMSLRFSAPVTRALAGQVRLQPASGTALAPVFDKDDKATEVSEVSFPVPLSENARFSIVLPKGLQDSSGRPLANAASYPLKVATAEAPPIAKFAAAPFGIVESADPVLPVTLRHVQADLRGAAATAAGAGNSGQGPVSAKGNGAGNGVRVKRVDSDADILAWYQKLQRYHERTLTAQEAGLPKSQWTTIEREQDARGRMVERRVERTVGTRELSLLNTLPEVKRLALPQLDGGDPRPFEVVGIPLGEPGYHVVEIESRRLGQSLLDKAAPMFVRTGVLVTNLGVHFKLGRENSLVWVTSLDRAKPVAGAEVAVHDCRGKRLWAGRTDGRGIAAIAQALDPDMGECPEEAGFFVTARHPITDGPLRGRSDVAFVFSQWQQGIEPWRFNQPTASGPQAELRAHTVFDRSLFRAGETVSMKHLVRLETGTGLAAVPTADLPTRMKIVHQGSGQEVVLPLRWRGGRSALASWDIPPAAKLGSYLVTLERDGGEDGRRRSSWTSGEFRVEEFRVPLVDARLTAPKAVPIAPKELPLSLQLSYLSGGGMAAAPARGSALLQPRTPGFAGHEDYSFEPPREGPRAADPDEPGEAAREGQLVADKLPLTTDRAGAATWTLKDLPPITRPSELLAEVSFNDPNGEVQTVSSRIALWPAAVVPGIRAASWASSRGLVKFSALALDTAGRPIKGQALEVKGRRSQVTTSRKRLVGGFYAYDNHEEVQDLGVLCSGRSDDRGVLLCEAELKTAGEVELVVQARDAAGLLAQAASSVWVTRQGELWFAQDNDDRIDVLPEKKQYEPGETARLQVRMPFREATALVAVEREGVIDTRVITLRGDDPTVELKIEPGWGPNVYVSVLALRGRIREVPWYSFFTWGWREPLSWVRAFWYDGRAYQAPTAMVDLAKPAFKLGVASLKVGLAAHELQVSVTPDKAQYGVRQKVRARIKVSQGGQPLAGTEVAFAAVDEGLLALRDNTSWDLLHAMLQQRDWGVATSTAQSEIIGRRHYGRKAVAAGGGGGRGGTRELFDTLLLWQPAVQLDAQGEALVEVPLNDSLTSFRLVAVADSGVQKFGTGSATVRVTQELQLLAGLPPLVRDGDQFNAMLTLRNTTAKDMQVRATLQGAVRTGSGLGPDFTTTPMTLPPQEVSLPAGSAKELVWPVSVPAESFAIGWAASVEEQGGGKAKDALKFNQLVSPAVPLRVTMATLAQLDGSSSLAVAPPADALPEAGPKRGGLSISVQPRLGGALPGIRRYFETYPYACLEQKASKAIGLADKAMWATVANTLPSYLDSDGLAGYFPPRAGDPPSGSDRLTAYVIAAAHEAGYELPPAAREAMLAGLTAFVEGRIERRFWSPRPDLEVRKLAALEALSRHGRALPRQLGSISLAPNTWPTAAVIDWLRILQRVEGIPDRAKRREEAQQILRSRLSYAGTTLKFSNEGDDFWWWLMDSADANAARLLLAVLDEPGWKDEIPRLVTGALGRQRGGAWLNTTANLWGALALDKFSARFESQPVTGVSRFELGSTLPGTASIDWAKLSTGGRVGLPWPAQPASLTATHQGSGKPWLTVQSLAAIPLKAPLSAGYVITRSVSAVEQKDKARWSRGDVLRVRLEVDAQADMSWVVIADPVPGGATVLGSGLGRDSAIATRGERREGSAWVAYEERSQEAFRAYYAQLPRGKHVVEYSVRLNNPGKFALPPTRVEAMYAPESFGELPNATIEVAP
jgi:alpha-2-macroglobulin